MVQLSEACKLIAEKAAREYERNTKNPYFKTRPEELHEVLVSIILGAYQLIEKERQ